MKARQAWIDALPANVRADAASGKDFSYTFLEIGPDFGSALYHFCHNCSAWHEYGLKVEIVRKKDKLKIVVSSTDDDDLANPAPDKEYSPSEMSPDEVRRMVDRAQSEGQKTYFRYVKLTGHDPLRAFEPTADLKLQAQQTILATAQKGAQA